MKKQILITYIIGSYLSFGTKLFKTVIDISCSETIDTNFKSDLIFTAIKLAHYDKYLKNVNESEVTIINSLEL